MINNKDFAIKFERIARDYKTLYVMGCFGAPLTDQNKARYKNNHSYNRRGDRSIKIQAASSSTYGFDCVGLIKAVLWGWTGSQGVYGGATYASNGVPDIDANVMLNRCSNISTNFTGIEVGEVVWKKDHIGVYIGNGLAVECTPAWNDGVQITGVLNIAYSPNHYNREWTKHGKLPWVDYGKEIDMSKNGWQKHDDRWIYLEDGKRLKSAWKKDSLDWCYVDERGYMLTNAWVKDSQGWCFVKDDGHLLRSGYACDGSGEHWIDDTGHMKK